MLVLRPQHDNNMIKIFAAATSNIYTWKAIVKIPVPYPRLGRSRSAPKTHRRHRRSKKKRIVIIIRKRTKPSG